MKSACGWWLPEGETHLIEWMQKVGRRVDGRLAYQFHKLEAALSWCRQFRTAVDIGAHVGLWSWHLATQFDRLHAFEPVAAHRACWERNMDGRGGLLYPYALGEREGAVAIRTAADSGGDSWVDGDGEIPMKRLDDFDLQDVDFVKIDCEGYELHALRGGEQTLLRCRPCVIVEQKPGRAQKFGLAESGAVDYLQGLGARLRRAMSGDYILSWD